MVAKKIKLFEENPEERKLEEIASIVKKGGVVIYPTDTVYGLGCDIYKQQAIDRIRKIKGIKSKQLNLAFICYDLSDIASYTRHLDTPLFKLMKKTLPGPYTYLLESSAKVPKILNVKKKTVGIRIPDNNIPREIVRILGNPILTTSIHEDDVEEYLTDPDDIYDSFKHLVDIIIDGGPGTITPSTIIDCTQGEPTILREGAGAAELEI
ncbi:MAG: L-threonylcarbamoyladenylate synthase [Bacteroidota bacterium]